MNKILNKYVDPILKGFISMRKSRGFGGEAREKETTWNIQA
jgi:hypothetical protein